MLTTLTIKINKSVKDFSIYSSNPRGTHGSLRCFNVKMGKSPSKK